MRMHSVFPKQEILHSGALQPSHVAEGEKPYTGPYGCTSAPLGPFVFCLCLSCLLPATHLTSFFNQLPKIPTRRAMRCPTAPAVPHADGAAPLPRELRLRPRRRGCPPWPCATDRTGLPPAVSPPPPWFHHRGRFQKLPISRHLSCIRNLKTTGDVVQNFCHL